MLITELKSSSDIMVRILSLVIPALFTNTSTVPKLLIASFINASAWSNFDMSAWKIFVSTSLFSNVSTRVFKLSLLLL